MIKKYYVSSGIQMQSNVLNTDTIGSEPHIHIVEEELYDALCF